MDTRVYEGELTHLIVLDLEKWHEHAVNGQSLYFMLEHKLSQIFERELVHL
jgi:hypothetical protein